MGIRFRTVSELLELTEKHDLPISEVMIQQEMDIKGKNRDELYEQMEKKLASHGKSN